VGAAALLAESCHGSGYCPPTADTFIYSPVAQFTIAGLDFKITKITILLWIGCALIIAFFLAAVRRPKLVPGRVQWIAESMYSFVRDGIAREVIGPKGVKFAPYMAALFAFVLLMNVYEIIPFAQVPVTGRFAFPVLLTAITYIMFIWVGIKEKGMHYFRDILFPPGMPKAIYLLLTPIELASTFVFRPLTLAVRLFANMFAGHLMLLVFFTGTTYLLTVGNFSMIFSLPAFLMAIMLTFFELLVCALQAYVFTILTAVYVSDAYTEH